MSRGASLKQEGLKGFGNSSPCHASESLSPIRFAEEERHISPLLDKQWWDNTGEEREERNAQKRKRREAERVGERESPPWENR